MAIPTDAGAQWERAATYLRRHVPDLLAVIGHGAAGRGESLPGAPIELVAVMHVLPDTQGTNRLQRHVLDTAGADRLELASLEAHRLGWLRPSVFQQSLVAGGTLVWGDAAALRVIPNWRPDQLDPRVALDELTLAQVDLADGWPAMAVQRAAGALLIARRHFEPRFDRRAAALQKWWPEAPVLPAIAHQVCGAAVPHLHPAAATGHTGHVPDAPAFVDAARRLVHDWLFTWEGAGAGMRAIERYQTLWQAGRAATLA